MARPRRLSDIARNVRRRYEREAARYEKQAQGASEAEANLLMAAAEQAREEAQRYYWPAIQRRAEIGITPEAQLARAEAQSLEALAARSEDDRQARVSDILMSSHIGKQIMAGTVDIWAGLDYDERMDAILEFFGAESEYELLLMLSEQGIDFTLEPTAENYEIIKLMIQERVAYRMAAM